MLAEAQISSPSLPGARRVWIQRPSAPTPKCCIFLDGELHVNHLAAPPAIEELWKMGRLPAVNCVYLSFGEQAFRHVDFICNPSFSAFLVDDFIPWIESIANPHDEFFLAGLSLSGLAAIDAALRHPDQFSGVLSQSPSAWWKDEWLLTQLSTTSLAQTRIWLSVGDGEVEENVSHAPTLFQATSQLDSCRRLAAKLETTSKETHYSEFHGGHDPVCWAAELPLALTWLLK